jgi:hypothetical protein
MDFWQFLFAINPRAPWHGLLVLLLAALAALFVIVIPPKATGTRLPKMIGYGIAAMLVLVVVQLVIAGTYFFNPSYLDHVEPAVVAITWLGWEGHPIFPDLVTGDAYGTIYGPALYQVSALFLWLFGPSVAASKIAGVVAFVAAPILLYAALRRSGAGIAEALAVAVAPWLVQAGFGDQAYSFGARADPFLFLIGAGAVAVATSGPTARSAALLGVLGGLAMNLKIHGALYVLPMVAYCLFQAEANTTRLRLAAIAGTAGLIAVALPFLPQNVSLLNYLHYVEMASHHRIDRWIFEKNVVFTALCLGPALWLYAAFVPKLPRGFGWFAAAMLASMAVSAVMGAKEGSGPHHLLPFVPLCAWAFFAIRGAVSRSLSDDAGSAKLAAISLGLIVALVIGYTPILLISWSRELRNFSSLPLHRAAIAEIGKALDDNPGVRIAVGPGITGDFDPTFLRVIPVFRGNPLPVDTMGWMDFEHGGASDDVVRKAVAECRVDLWLVPTGTAFTTINLYSGTALFSDAVRAAFHATYQQESSGQIFDLWRCKRKGQASVSHADSAPSRR